LLAPYRQLFSDYIALSKHSYATVRAEAQAGVERAASYFGFLLDEALPQIVNGQFNGQTNGQSNGQISADSIVAPVLTLTHQELTGDIYIM
jgi:esterase/lipase superfamily enzyme